MRMYDIIRKKRNGGELTRAETELFINGALSGCVPDYQISALLMAIYFNGMTDSETAILTDVMAHSGDVIDLSQFGRLSVDKHSTGGVGDKTTFIAAPIAAACGCKVTKMSGRGLGFTGGTVDKLQSIPGYHTEISAEDFIKQIESVGMAVVGQSGNLAPADKKIYALRDVTATVESIPLIASSIMSKKIAAGSHNIVLDVKIGSGAFMKTPQDAELLAEKMVTIGKQCGRNTAAVITDMNAPLGSAVGNSLEVAEAAQILRDNTRNDLTEVSLSLAANMISLACDIPFCKAFSRAEDALKSGTAFEVMLRWIAFQGGDISYIENPHIFKKARYVHEVKSRSNGFITSINAECVGTSAMLLGAGRTVMEDIIDHSAGIAIVKKTGERICRGDTLCLLHASDKSKINEAEDLYLRAVAVGDNPPEKKSLIYKVIC